jgi:hypothetical protein
MPEEPNNASRNISEHGNTPNSIAGTRYSPAACLHRRSHGGNEAYKRDNPKAKVLFYDTGRFALETHAVEIGQEILTFLKVHLCSRPYVFEARWSGENSRARSVSMTLPNRASYSAMISSRRVCTSAAKRASPSASRRRPSRKTACARAESRTRWRDSHTSGHLKNCAADSPDTVGSFSTHHAFARRFQRRPTGRKRHLKQHVQYDRPADFSV